MEISKGNGSERIEKGPDQDVLDLRVRNAMEEVRLYLSGTLPPASVVDSVALLLEYPPQLLASNIHAWIGLQQRSGSSLPVSEYLFHAVKKMHLLGRALEQLGRTHPEISGPHWRAPCAAKRS